MRREYFTEDKLFLYCITVTVIVAIIATAVYHINDRILMSKNIDSAVSKGVDPLAVRCSYVGSQDSICVAFASSTKQIVIESNKK